MAQHQRKMVIIGGGIAGLCTAVYAQKCGYNAEVLEMHSMPGGLAMSWNRGQYTFETCLHWLLGSKSGGEMNAQWLEVVDLSGLQIVDPIEFTRIETESGDCLHIYADVDRLEAEFLQRAPQDKAQILRFTNAVRRLGNFRMPDPGCGLFENGGALLHDATCLPLMHKLSNISGRDYGELFSDPLIRTFFGGGEMGNLAAIALVFSLAWMNTGNAGYAVGGAQSIIRGIAKKLADLGGRIRCGAKVGRILVEQNKAVGVELVTGESVYADWVVSAADGYTTIHKLLSGKYQDAALAKFYQSSATFPSYAQVSLGVAVDLRQQPSLLTLMLDAPLKVDEGTYLNQVGIRFFHFDPTFAPAGKTAVTCFLPTCNFEYWTELQKRDPHRYCAEKRRLSELVIGILEKRVPQIREAIEVVDVSTPATVIRYTGNWKGSMEGWLLAPGMGFKPLRNTLPGLENFIMVGQWVMPGGGLPSGLMTARSALRSICKQDRVPFATREAALEPVGVA